jgi:hypothetical protein
LIFCFSHFEAIKKTLLQNEKNKQMKKELKATCSTFNITRARGKAAHDSENNEE